MKVTDFTVELVQRNAVVGFIEKHHYSHNINGVQSYYHFGLFRDGKFGLPEMIGAMLYAMPSMPSTAKKYNPINPTKCFELRRLVCIDDTPTNTESYFIGQTFKWLKQNTDIEVIVSFADEEYGHSGIIYKATNFEYCGTTSPSKKLIVDGKEYHSRSLNQSDRPYGRELKRRYDAGDENIYWKNTKFKHIYVYYFNKKIQKQIKRLKDE
jgi:hypothetical protein|tara:strand:- start:755 stop:1384 length:630 start_codon:yes stop_codon:yes gene_type:complete